MKLFAAVLILLPQFASGQDAESLRARIEAHYTAIHASDRDVTRSHHLPEISIFPGDGHLLMEPGWDETGTRMGAEIPFPDAVVTMKHFSAQMYGDVGIALFYLDGPHGTFRVSAVWVWRDGEWLEAHHHESALSG